MRILIVTDDSSSPEHLEEILSKQGHTVEHADTEAALENIADYDTTVVAVAERKRLVSFLERLHHEWPGLCGRTIVVEYSKDCALEELICQGGFGLAPTYQAIPAMVEKMPYTMRGSIRAFPLLYPLLLIIATLLFLPPAPGTATEPGTCVSCHQDVHRNAITVKYRHSVVTDEKCATCHIIEQKNWDSRLLEQAISKEYTTEALVPLGDIAERNKRYTIKVIAWDKTSRRSAPVKLTLEPEGITPLETESPSTLSIQNIKVEEVRHGIFSTATISWLTNEFTRAAVEYGETRDYINVTPWEYAYSREHRVTLRGLKQGRRYHYRIILKDVFGNMIRSSDLLLDTREPRYSPQGTSSITRGFPSIEKAEVTSINGIPFLLVRTDRPARITVTLKASADDKTHGDGFLPPKTTQIDVCVECHNQSVSHPVGISASTPSTVVPRNLPTLEGGIITCVTCHYPHGSNKPFFARMDFERDICIECHRKGPFI